MLVEIGSRDWDVPEEVLPARGLAVGESLPHGCWGPPSFTVQLQRGIGHRLEEACQGIERRSKGQIGGTKGYT